MTSHVDVWAPRCFAFGPFMLDPDRPLLLREGVPVRIGGRALHILAALVERPGELHGKRELMARVWPNAIVEDENLKVHMVALRRALGDEVSAARYIATVKGRGYRFVAPVRSGGSGNLALATATAAASSGNLPPETVQILGRAEAIDNIRRGLDEVRLVSIVGAGGIGKTTLAIAVARVAARQCADGAAFIDLAAISDPQFIPAVVASAAGLDATGGDPLSGVVHALKSRQKILLFDNCEHLLPAVAAAVDRLVRNLEGVRILATSREPLRLRGERVYRLGGLGCDPSQSPTADEARKFPAVELFATRASERAGYQLTDADAPVVAEICRRLEGNALAIELAATQTARFLPTHVRDMLDDRFYLLNPGLPGVPLRQQTLRATIDWSYSLLADPEAVVLRAVSVFATTFDTAGALAVSNASPAEVLDALAQLAAKSLLAADTTAGGIAYRVLEATRAYAVDRLQASGEDQAVRRRHAEHVCTVLERAATEWARRPAGEWGATYGRVLDDLRAALAFAGRDAADRSLLIRLTVAGAPLWNHLSLDHESHAHFARGVQELNAAGLAGTATEMTLQLSLAGTTMFTRGFLPEALAAMQRALSIAVRIGNTEHHLRSLRLIASYEKFLGEHDAGKRTLETFTSVAAATDPSALPDGETHIGMGQIFVGELQSCRHRLERLYRNDMQDANGPRLARFSYDRNVDVGNVLSNAQWLTGSPDAAARTVEATVERALKIRHGLSLSNALAVAACPVSFLGGRYREAGHYASMLDDQVMRNGIAIWRPVALFYRAALECEVNDTPADGVDGLERAIAEFRAINHWVRMPFYLGVLANALAKLGSLSDAETKIRAALDLARSRNERWCVPELLRIRAALFTATNRPDDAEAALVESMAFAKEIGAVSWRLRAAIDLAKLWRARSRASDARRMLRSVYDEFTEGFATRDLVIAAGLLAG